MVQVIQHFHGAVGAVQTGASSMATVATADPADGVNDGDQ
jgi:hypothetical protein